MTGTGGGKVTVTVSGRRQEGVGANETGGADMVQCGAGVSGRLVVAAEGAVPTGWLGSEASTAGAVPGAPVGSVGSVVPSVVGGVSVVVSSIAVSVAVSVVGESVVVGGSVSGAGVVSLVVDVAVVVAVSVDSGVVSVGAEESPVTAVSKSTGSMLCSRPGVVDTTATGAGAGATVGNVFCKVASTCCPSVGRTMESWYNSPPSTDMVTETFRGVTGRGTLSTVSDGAGGGGSSDPV